MAAPALPDVSLPDASAKPKGGGLVPFIAVTLVLAALGGGGGFMLVRHAMEVARGEAKTEQAQAKIAVPDAVSGTRTAVALPPLITTMATSGTWVRLETVMVYDAAKGQPAPTLAPQLTEDMLAFLRTLTIGHVTGPSGFLHLKQDLTERARLRSDGFVEDILIQVLVFE
ncbi:MAG: flagellar basal body-associated FliL family protein [Rhizobiaceae bacterium]|jgi:flagellar FliL protein|nr:flagellar basal body-associated FliL family protein [Rhizobiaceae bacterium]